MKAIQIDWLQLEKEYIFGTMVDGKRVFLTSFELAEKYNTKANTVRQRAYQGKWKQDREETSNKISQHITNTVVKEISSEASELKIECFRNAQKAVRVHTYALDLVLEDIEKVKKGEKDKVDPYFIKKTNTSTYGIQGAQDIANDALGESKETESTIEVTYHHVKD